MKVFDIFSQSCTYNFPLDDGSLKYLAKKHFSEETQKTIRWVHQMYDDWRVERNKNFGQDEIIECDLENVSTISESSLLIGMTKFITEVRKLDGSDFPPKTLYQIVICVQFHLETLGYTWRLIDDKMFTDLRFTLDNLMKMRTSLGIGINVRKADVISKTDEDILWCRNVLGTQNPEQLLHTVLYVVGLSCALCAGKEHRSLRSIPFNSQFIWLTDDNGSYFLRYKEDIGLKTNKGGLKHRKFDVKEVDVFPKPSSDRCAVAIIMKYMSLLPVERKCSAFYLQPLHNFTDNCWYQDKPVGVNKLQSIVKVIAEKGGLPGYYTNHSLRATAATRLYQGQFDEQVIQELTGHRSLAVRSNKRTSSEQRKKCQ